MDEGGGGEVKAPYTTPFTFMTKNMLVACACGAGGRAARGGGFRAARGGGFRAWHRGVREGEGPMGPSAPCLSGKGGPTRGNFGVPPEHRRCSGRRDPRACSRAFQA